MSETGVSVNAVNVTSMSQKVDSISGNARLYHQSIEQPILVNGVPLGTTASPTELYRVNYKGREMFVQLFFDEGSQLTLVNRQCSPIVSQSRISNGPIRIGSVTGSESLMRSIQTIYLNETYQLEAVLVPDLALITASIQRPDCLKEFDGQWALQVASVPNGQLLAQILIGADNARLFPQEVNDIDGFPIRTQNCRVKRSVISGRYLLFGHAEPGDQLVRVDFPQINMTTGRDVQRQVEEYEAVTIEDVVDIDSE